MLTKITDDLWVDLDEVQEIIFNGVIRDNSGKKEEKYDALIIYKEHAKTILSKENAEALKKILNEGQK